MEKITVLLLTTLLVLGCITPDKTTTTSIPQTSTTLGAEPKTTTTLAADDGKSTPEGISNVVSANNKLAIDLYHELSDGDENMFFSPWSISSALSMTYEGARGKTADEMKTVLHIKGDDDVRRSSFAAVQSSINSGDNAYSLSTANALWLQKDYPFLEDYTFTVSRYYSSTATNVDFVGETEKSRQTINAWVEEKTNEKIKDLIPKGLLDSTTRLVLTNAIYFKGSWQNQFDKALTEERDFHITADRTTKAQMMSFGKRETLNYAETGKMQLLELPYEGDSVSMLIILPKEDNLDSVESSLTEENLMEWQKSMIKQKVMVSVPKFKMKTKYSLGDNLKEMGMPTAFSNDADFSGMDGTRKLYISAVVHQGFVEVDEEGTEAAAATGVIVAGMTAMPDYKVFNADHPFIIIISEKDNGNILFMGRVTNPTA